MKQHLQVATLQQDFQQARPLEIVQRLMVQANQQGLIRALLQQSASSHSVLRVEAVASSDRLDAVKAFVAFREKMLEAKTLSGERRDPPVIALDISAARSDWSLGSASRRGLQTFFRMMHVLSRFL